MTNFGKKLKYTTTIEQGFVIKEHDSNIRSGYNTGDTIHLKTT
jgi:hypothetical protein